MTKRAEPDYYVPIETKRTLKYSIDYHFTPEEAKEYTNEVPVVWPSAKLKGFPCATCKHAKPNTHSQSGYECTVDLARACAPWGPAWKHAKT